MDTPPTPRGRSFDGPVRRVQPRHRGDTPATPIEPTFTVRPLQDDEAAGLPQIRPEPTPTTPKPPKRFPRHLRRNVLLGIAALIIVGVGWFGYHAWAALHAIIQKHTGPSAFSTLGLKGEGSGRVNILVMGEGGAGHDGPDLTDTMIVYSIDPKTNDVAAISVPRDMYVKIPGHGYAKINSANADGGPQLAEKVVNNVLGITINYYVVVDFSGFKQAVDAVGGVDINVATALYDTAYPCDVGNGVCPYHQSAGLIHMNGATALKYSRCRHDAPTGNCGNDYGRSARQQQIITALKSKALSLGTLTNPAKLTSLIDTVGGHVKTDLQINDLKTLGKLASKIDSSKIVSKVLDDAPDSYLVGGVNIIPEAGYIYVPKAGNFNYSDIQDFVKNIFVDRYITSENARIEIDNGSGVAGLAGKVVTSLKLAHYNIAPAANADTTYAKTIIYDYTGGKKPYTIKYLESRFGVTAQKATLPSASPTASPASGQTPEIRIILGSDYASSSASKTTSP